MASPRLLTGRNSRLDAYYSVTTVTQGRRTWFADSSMAQLVATEIIRCEEESRVASIAWVVMPEHVHWLFQLKQGSLSRCLQAFKSRSARAVNALAGGVGNLWQAGFYDHCVRSDEDLSVQARYLIENPLRRGLADRIERYPHWYCQWPDPAAA